MVSLKKLPAAFFRTLQGNEPVRDWLLGLPEGDRKALGHAICDVEYGWPLGMPLCRSLGDGLWEIRASLPSNRIARIIFCVEGSCMVLLHGFIKKTQKTPAPDMALARQRVKELRTHKE